MQRHNNGDDEIQQLKANASKRYERLVKSHYLTNNKGIKSSVQDLPRIERDIYINEENVFEINELSTDDIKAKEETIKKNIKAKLLVHTKLQDYVINKAHQNGFLHDSETLTKEFFFMVFEKIFTVESIEDQIKRFDFIVHDERSISFIEHFYVHSVKDMHPPEIHNPKIPKLPLMVGIRKSIFILNDKDEVDRFLLEDRFLIVDEEGKQLENCLLKDKSKNSKTIIEKFHADSLEEVNEEIRRRVKAYRKNPELVKNFYERKNSTYLNRAGQFVKNHWDKILLGGVLAAGLVVIGIFTAGVVPAIAGAVAGVLGVSTVLGAVIGVGAITLGATAAGALATGIAASQTKESTGLGSFMKRHWRAIAVGAVVGALVVGAVVAGIFTFGVGTVVLGAVGTGIAAGFGLFGLKMAAGIGIGIGAAAITKGAVIAGAVAGAVVGGALGQKKSTAKILSTMHDQPGASVPASKKDKEKAEPVSVKGKEKGEPKKTFDLKPQDKPQEQRPRFNKI